MTVQFDQVVFAYGMDEIYSSGGIRFLRDRGPYQFDMQFPGGAADPVLQLDASLYFNGAPQYVELPAGRRAEFYAQIPTGTMTLLLCHAPTAATGVIWSTWNNTAGGVNQGVFALAQTSSAVAPRLYQPQGGAGLPYISGTVAHTLSRKYVVSYTMEVTPRGLTDGTTNGAAWIGGAFGAAVYAPALSPRIGSHPSGAGGYQGRQYFSCLIRGALSSADLAFYSRLIAEGGRPFCWRQT